LMKIRSSIGLFVSPRFATTGRSITRLGKILAADFLWPANAAGVAPYATFQILAELPSYSPSSWLGALAPDDDPGVPSGGNPSCTSRRAGSAAAATRRAPLLRTGEPMPVLGA
jgi:hypothetical protein